MFLKKIAIDLGTTYTLVHVPKRGIIINEPSVVAVSPIIGKFFAVREKSVDLKVGRIFSEII